jgi:hypothetical protein
VGSFRPLKQPQDDRNERSAGERPASAKSLLLVAVARIDELEIGAGEIPVVGNMLDRFDQVEADQSAAASARREGFAGKNDDIVIGTMCVVIDAVESRDRSRVARPMPLITLLNQTQENPRVCKKDTPPL